MQLIRGVLQARLREEVWATTSQPSSSQSHPRWVVGSPVQPWRSRPVAPLVDPTIVLVASASLGRGCRPESRRGSTRRMRRLIALVGATAKPRASSLGARRRWVSRLLTTPSRRAQGRRVQLAVVPIWSVVESRTEEGAVVNSLLLNHVRCSRQQSVASWSEALLRNSRLQNKELERTRSRANGLREPCRSIQCSTDLRKRKR